MELRGRLGRGQAQGIETALELRAAEVVRRQGELLQVGAHRAVEDQDALAQLSKIGAGHGSDPWQP